MHPALEILFALGVNKAADKMVESVEDELFKRLPPDADVLIVSPQLWLAKRRAERSLKELKFDLGEKIDRLDLICRAMWELIRERSRLSEKSLLEKVEELGLLSQSLHSEIKNIPRKCSKCGRKVPRASKRCIYCGSPEFLDTNFKPF